MSIPTSAQPREKKPRRKRGTVVDPVLTSWRIERETRDRVAALAKRASMSPSEFIEQLIEHIELTDQGIPTWMPALPRDGELPIDVP